MVKKWYWVSIPLLFFTFVGLWFYVILPRTYEATTLIVVQSQEIPSSYVQPSVGTAIEEQVMTLSQEVLSRSNLENVIREMNLYPEARNGAVPMDILVAGMRKKIEVNTTTDGRRGGTVSFTISFKGAEPKKVADVTNKLASFFIDSNLKQRARRATETTAFLEKQLADLKVLLQEQEAKVQAYRNQFMGELPEQMTSNVATMNSLQLRLETVQTSLAAAMNRRIALQSQLSALESNQPGATVSENAQRIVQLKAQYEESRARYTPEHPSVKLLQQQIKELEGRGSRGEATGLSPQVIDLKTQLKSANLEVESARNELARIQHKIDFYQGRVETTPKREQELATITRDYNITQENYQRLLDRYYEAKRAESMEMRQQGEQFRIVDYAQMPEVPVSPNALMIAMVFLALGLGTGAGLIILLELMDSTVKGIKQLENWSGGIPCLSAVPLALTENDLTLRKKRVMVYIGINVVIFVAGVIIVGYSHFADLTVNLPVPIPF